MAATSLFTIKLRHTCLALSLLIICHIGHAQAKYKTPRFYKGFEGAIGGQTAIINSDLSALNALKWVAEGGKVSVVGGSQKFLTRAGFGLYYSANNVKQTIDLFTMEAGTNFYPLAFLNHTNTRLSPYFSGGVLYNMYKFAGTYLDEDNAMQNYSMTKENYIGKVHQVNFTFGAGLEFRPMDHLEFLYLFTEINYGKPLYHDASIVEFANTTTSSQLLVHAGFRVGLAKR